MTDLTPVVHGNHVARNKHFTPLRPVRNTLKCLTMKRTELRPQEYVRYLVCDRCGREADRDGTDSEFHEFTSIQYRAGYGSVFGDGKQVEVDLCQHCIKDTLGAWLRVTDPLAGFSLEQHGGEFPYGSQSGFAERGLAAVARSIANDDAVPAEQVIAKLENRLAQARRALLQRPSNVPSSRPPTSPSFRVGSPVVTNTPLPDLDLESGVHGSIVHIHGTGDVCDVEFVNPADGTTAVKTVDVQWLSAWKLI